MRLKTTECNGTVYHHSPSVYFRCAPPAENAWVVIHRRFAACVESGRWDASAEKLWHDTEWMDLIPACGSCREHYSALAQSIDWSTAESASFSMYEIHNHVSREYAGRQEISIGQFEALYFQQPSMDDCCVAVTSLNPDPEAVDRQSLCLDSWRRFGLSIVAMQTDLEADELRSVYPQVGVWCQYNGATSTPKIKYLANVAAIFDRTALVLNADIELHGRQSIVRDAIARGTLIGLRHNYNSHWWLSSIEDLGIDAFSFTPGLAESLPDVPFLIGKPWWDFWLLNHFRGTPTSWITEPLFFHRTHDVRWSESDWNRYADLFASVVGRRYERSEIAELRSSLAAYAT